MFPRKLKNADGGFAVATWIPVLLILAAAVVMSELNERTPGLTDPITQRTVTVRIGPAIPLSLAQVAAARSRTAEEHVQLVQIPPRPARLAGPEEPTLAVVPGLEETVKPLVLREPTTPILPRTGDQRPRPPFQAVQSVTVEDVSQGAPVRTLPPRLRNGGRIVQWLRDAYDPALPHFERDPSVTLTLMVDASGRVQRAHALDALDPALEAMAVDAARRMRFHPALRGGRPIPAWVNQRIAFSAG